MKNALLKWGASLFALVIVLIIILAAAGRLGFPRFINRMPLGDKIGRFVLYGTLALFRSLPHLNRHLLSVRIASVLALLIGFKALSQVIFPNRSFDLVFSYLGVIFFSWVVLKKT